jgi:NAD(P)-dependent dehydrogenase (short-subunit alcohol dehydrogenase family)
MLTQDVALDFAPFNINVNCICPGIIVTALLSEKAVPKGMDPMVFVQTVAKQNIPMQREGYPEDIGNAALFFASELSSYITGQIIVVGGGAPLSRIKISG